MCDHSHHAYHFLLESGFPDARSLLRASRLLAFLALFSTYRFPAAKCLRRLNTPVPVVVIHGDDDQIVPIMQGRALFDTIAAPKRFLTIHGGDHNDVAPSDPDTYWEEVNGFIESLQSAGSQG